MDSNLVIFSLQYTYLIKPCHSIFESSTGLWQDHSQLSPALIPYGALDHHKQEDVCIIDNISSLRSTVIMLNHNGLNETNHIKLIEPQLNNKLITVSINGTETFVNNSRAEIINAYSRVGFRKIPLTFNELKAICQNFLHRLNSLALRFDVEIIVSDCEFNFDGVSIKSDETSIFVLGDERNLSCAETHIKILIETILDGCFVEQVPIPWSSVPFLGGAGLSNLIELTRQSKATVHLPDIWSFAFESSSSNNTSDVCVWLTSPKISELALTKKALKNMLGLVDITNSKTVDVFSQKVNTSKEKIDLIYLHYEAELRSIMLKQDAIATRSFTSEGGGQISVQGHVYDSVLEAAQSISSLSCRLHRLNILFKQGRSPADLEFYFISLVNQKKTCILAFNEYGINILGSKGEINLLLKELIADLKDHHSLSKIFKESETGCQISLDMELSNDHKDFLAGKKNGKIMKVLSQLGFIPTIRFTRINDLNFCISSIIQVGATSGTELLHTAFSFLLHTVDLIELELPAELQFNVPEVFHKSLIGNGGSIIQSIMKRYNVFIKFSRNQWEEGSPKKSVNSFEQNLHLFKRKNNVVIRCPMKNSRNIMQVKYDIDQLVLECCQARPSPYSEVSVIYNTVKFRLLKSHFLLLNREMNFNPRFTQDLEINYSTFIDYPKSIDAFSSHNDFLITIKGNENKARLCAEELARLLPKSITIEVWQPDVNSFVVFDPTNESFREHVVIPFSLLLQTELVAQPISDAYYGGMRHEITLSSYDASHLTTAAFELAGYMTRLGFMANEKKSTTYRPIVSVDEVISPSKSTRNYNSCSPSKSSSKSPQKSISRSPEKAPWKNTSRNGSPYKSGKKLLGVITNQQNGSILKSMPRLNHQEVSRVLF